MTDRHAVAAGDQDTAQVRALRALQALVAEHEVADAGTECAACPGQSYPCDTRTYAEEAADRLRHRMSSPRHPVGSPTESKE